MLRAARSLVRLVRAVGLLVVIAFGVVFSVANYPWLAAVFAVALFALVVAVSLLRGRG